MRDLVSHQLVRYLEARGVTHVFGLCGHTNIAVLSAMANSKIHFVNVRHEQIAAHAADGYARVTGKASVLLTHLGPGLTNAATGVANAALDCIPMVVIAGDMPSHYYGKHPHQEVNLHADGGAVRDLQAVREARLARGKPGAVPGDHREGVPAGRERPARPGAGRRADGHLLQGSRRRAFRSAAPQHQDAGQARSRRRYGGPDRSGARRSQEAGSLCRRRRRAGATPRTSCTSSSITWAFRWRTA